MEARALARGIRVENVSRPAFVHRINAVSKQLGSIKICGLDLSDIMQVLLSLAVQNYWSVSILSWRWASLLAVSPGIMDFVFCLHNFTYLLYMRTITLACVVVRTDYYEKGSLLSVIYLQNEAVCYNLSWKLTTFM